MRDPDRIPVVLNYLEEYWKRNPDLRLTQLMWNLAGDKGVSVPHFYNTEEEALEVSLLKRLDEGVDTDPGRW